MASSIVEIALVAPVLPAYVGVSRTASAAVDPAPGTSPVKRSEVAVPTKGVCPVPKTASAARLILVM